MHGYEGLPCAVASVLPSCDHEQDHTGEGEEDVGDLEEKSNKAASAEEANSCSLLVENGFEECGVGGACSVCIHFNDAMVSISILMLCCVV